MARRMNLYASKITNLFVLIFIMLFVVNFCHTFNEETKLIAENNFSDNLMAKLGDENIQDYECTQFFFLNVSFAVILAMLWNAGRAMKIGTI